MSEQNNSGFPFAPAADGGLDIDTIFGGAPGASSDVNPFEELRIAKADDFPELSEGKKVSWTVEYGKITKAITVSAIFNPLYFIEELGDDGKNLLERHLPMIPMRSCWPSCLRPPGRPWRGRTFFRRRPI